MTQDQAPAETQVPNLGPSRLRRRRKRPSLWVRRAIAIGVLVAGAAMLGGGFGAISRAFFNPVPTAAAPAAGDGTKINTLIIAVNPKPLTPEPGEKASRRVAEGLYLLSLDSATKTGTVLSIPRQTRALLGTNGGGQLGDALALGGVPLLRETVEGVTGLQVDHYIWLEVEGAKTILGLLDKPKVFVPKDVKFSDPDSGVKLELSPGWQSLTPEQTVAYGMLRPDDAELDHLSRQQFLMHQWQEQIHGGFSWWWFSGAVSKLMPAVTTDLSKPDLATLANQLREVDPDDMTYALMPGEVSSAGDWLVSSKRYDSLLTKLQTALNAKPVSELKPTLEILYDAASESTDEKAGQKADAQVLNLATKLTEQGFQVVRTARAPVTAADSRLIDRARVDLRSKAVLQALDKAANGVLVELEPDETTAYGAQYTLELGKHFFR